MTFAFSLVAGGFIASVTVAAPFELDETPAASDEWGYRPTTNFRSTVSPPSFSWRPQKEVDSWELECTDTERTSVEVYRASHLSMNVHAPPQPFPAGQYRWRYRGVDCDGKKTNWSRGRTFSIAPNALPMPMPTRDALLARIPKRHPRLFVRPEEMAHLRELAKGPLRDRFEALIARCDSLVANPPPTAEPPKYDASEKRLSESWRKIWWGNRTYTVAALDAAATLGFTWQLSGNAEYGQLAKRILIDCAEWDPIGSTGYRYNDEAGMPYAYHFSRSYSFIHDLLSEEERDKCRRVMQVRGNEMYRHLYPRHLWRPYASHSNRAWHFLGEVAIAFHDDIEEADDWLWFAMNVFYNTYPVWSDADGGWHEGSSYWSSYIGRFLWWADVMQTSLGVRAYDKPYFSKVGDYPLYLMPPGKVGGGFGDGCASKTAAHYAPLASQFAMQARNPYWQWYAESMGGTKRTAGYLRRESYIGFIRGALRHVEAKPPTDLPTSKRFAGIGQAVLNSTLLDANDDVQVVFKSSPFGSRSHGYESNNAFLLWAYGQRLLIRSGRRDIHGSLHHRNWMWSTRSVNCITVDGQGQMSHAAESQGQIVDFQTTDTLDLVTGEAGSAYRKKGQPPEEAILDRFSRSILFVKPNLVIIYDRLVAKRKVAYDYWLHAVEPFDLKNGQERIGLNVRDVGCQIEFLVPERLRLQQTNEYDPNPRPRIKLREWHLTAATSDQSKRCEFLVLYRPYRNQLPESQHVLQKLDGGYALRVQLPDGRLHALFPATDSTVLQSAGLKTRGRIVARRVGPDGLTIETVRERDPIPIE